MVREKKKQIIYNLRNLDIVTEAEKEYQIESDAQPDIIYEAESPQTLHMKKS